MADHPLRAWRNEQRKTLARLSGEVGCSASHLSEIENGNNEPSLALAAKLSKATEIPIDRFVKQSEVA